MDLSKKYIAGLNYEVIKYGDQIYLETDIEGSTRYLIAESNLKGSLGTIKSESLFAGHNFYKSHFTIVPASASHSKIAMFEYMKEVILPSKLAFEGTRKRIY